MEGDWVRWGASSGEEIAAQSLASSEPVCCVLGALALAACNPASGVRWRFQGDGSLVTVPWLPLLIPIGRCQEPTWRVPRYPLPLPPHRGGWGERTWCCSALGIPW